MRLSQGLIIAGVLFAATPAIGQDNAAVGGNSVTSPPVDANAAAPRTPAAPSATAAPDQTATQVPVETHHGFPWGVLGLIGLIGLFGVRKVKG